MLKLENTDVFGWESAIRGMRNPMNSWDKSDSFWCIHQTNITIDELDKTCGNCPKGDNCDIYDDEAHYVVGENDLKLMQNLSKAGNDHSKFLRMINVTVDITAPLYWWKEFDTYKVGTVTNSCSTMHKIHAKEFTLDDFSHEHLDALGIALIGKIIDELNYNRGRFIAKPHRKGYWWQMIQLLPSSYNQKRTVQLNYQVLKSMYFARRNHKLDEWHTLCEWMEGLPYFKEVVIQE